MLDTLDLNYYVMLGKSYRRLNQKPWRRTLWFAVPILIIALLIWLNYKDAPGAVYTLQDGAWQKIDVPGWGVPISITSSSSGLIWVGTAGGSGVHRFDGENWTSFSPEDYGDENNDGSFALETHGDELWIALNNTVSHYANDTWTLYPDVFEYDGWNGNINVVASDQGVVLTINRLDGQKLYQFKNGHWEVVELIADLHANPDHLANISPTVFEGRDGTIFLAYRNIYRLNGDEWTRVAQLFNLVIDTIFVSDDYIVVTIRDGFIVYGVNTEDIQADRLYSGDFPDSWNGRFSVIGTDPDAITFTTESGELWQYSPNSEWRQLPQLKTPYTIKDVTTDSQGNLWVVANKTTSDVFVPFMVLNLLAYWELIIFLICFIYAISLYKDRASIARYRESQALLREICPDLPVYEVPKFLFQRPVWQWVLLFVFGTFVAVILETWGLPLFAVLIIMTVIITSVDIGMLVLASRNKQLSEEHRGYLQTISLMRLIINLFPIMAILLCILLFGDNIDTLAGFIIIGVVYFIALRITQFILTLPIRMIYRLWISKANYASADRMAQRLLKTMPFHLSFVSIKAIIDFLQGQTDSARYYVRRALGLLQNSGPAPIAIFVALLAHVEDYEDNEKLKILEQALKIAPETSARYIDLAEFYLERNIHPQRALEITDAMMNFLPSKPFLPQINSSHRWHDTLMMRAWALANVGRFEEANGLFDQVIPTMDERSYPSTAWIYTMAGHVKRLESQIEDARNYYQRAVTLDPNGHNGRLAAQALSELSSTTD